MSLLTISPSPHVRSSMTTQKIMLLVVLALVPAIVAATVVFGPRALFMVIYCAVISMFTELVCQRLMQKEVTVTDGSAMLTGVLLALNLPVTLPLWEAAIGCVFAVAVVKQLFGGLGCNFANPAITGRVFLLLSFGGDMTTWVKPFYYQGNNFIVKLFMDNPRIPDGAVTGVSFVTVSETPGLGTKVQSNPELLVDNLVGLSDETVVNGVDNITGATYSSKGMKAAVNCALATVSANQEVTGA